MRYTEVVDKLSTQFRVGRERHWVHCVSSAAAPYYSNLALLGGELQTLLILMLRLPRAGSKGGPGKQILIFQGRLAGARRGSEGKKLVKQEEKQQNSVKINPHQGT